MLDLALLPLADVLDDSPVKLLKGVIALITLVGGVVTWFVAKSMRGSAMKKWAHAKGLDYSAGLIVGKYHGYGLQVTMTDQHINKEQMRFNGTCRLTLQGRLPDKLRIVPRARAGMLANSAIAFSFDPAFEQALVVEAADQQQAAQLFRDPGLRQAVLHFFSVAPELDISDNAITTSVSGVAAIGGDPSHVMDTPLRRCMQLAQVLETALRGEAVDPESIPGLRAGGGLAKGPLKAKNLPAARKTGT